jgi:hypothetical protein
MADIWQEIMAARLARRAEQRAHMDRVIAKGATPTAASAPVAEKPAAPVRKVVEEPVVEVETEPVVEVEVEETPAPKKTAKKPAAD